MLYLLNSPVWAAPDEPPRPLPLTLPAALLVVLATENGWMAREQLALVFWPDASPADALHHVRINLHRARSLLAGWGLADALQAERARVRLTLPSDLALLRQAQERGDAAALARLSPTQWLQGWRLPGNEGFAQWCEEAAQRLQTEWLAAGHRATVPVGPHTPEAAPPGRADELRQLLDSPAPALLLLGEPGAGKTTLLRAAWPYAPCLRGLEGLHGMPYRPLLDVLRAHGSTLQRALREPGHPLRPYRLDLARLLPEWAPEEALPPLDAVTARSRLVEALTRAFEALCPVLLVDDLQWCDDASVEWLLMLAHSGRLRWRAAARTHEMPASLNEALQPLRHAARLQDMSLAPLDAPALAALCAQRCPGKAFSADELARLQALSGGNALLAVELLDAGLDTGVAHAQASVPDSVARLVLQRLQRLPAGVRHAVESAAVFVQPVPPDALGQRADLPSIAAGLLRQEGERLACRHDLIRQAITQSLPPARLALLHRQAALWLATQAERDAMTIAEHWRAGGEHQTALGWYHRGAEQLKARGSFAQARQLWRQVADESLDAAQSLRAQLELAACDLFEDLARGEAALEAVQARLSAVADAESQRQIEGRLRAALVDNRVFAGDLARAGFHAERLRVLLPALPANDQVDALEVLIELAMREPDIPTAWSLLAQLRQLAPQRPSLLSWEGQIHWFGGQAQAAHDALARLLERHPEYCSGMTIENDLAVMLHALGRAEEAEVMVRRSLQSWAGVVHAEAISLMVLGVVLISLARLEEAEDALQRALQLARDQASPGFEAEALVRRARLMLAWQRPAEAQAALAEAQVLLDNSPEPLRVSQFVLAQVQAARALDQAWPQAGVDRLHEIAQRSTHPLVHCRMARVAHEQALAAGDTAGAAAQAAAMAATARRHQLGETLAEALWLQAQTEPRHPHVQRWREEAQALALRGGLRLVMQRLQATAQGA